MSFVLKSDLVKQTRLQTDFHVGLQQRHTLTPLPRLRCTAPR